jgi:hypothetical protein
MQWTGHANSKNDEVAETQWGVGLGQNTQKSITNPWRDRIIAGVTTIGGENSTIGA